MPCLSAPVYDVDIFRQETGDTVSFVRERINPTGIPFGGNVLKKKSEINDYACNISEILNLQSLHDIDMMTDPQKGPVLLEVNPRPSGSLSALNRAQFPLLDFAWQQQRE